MVKVSSEGYISDLIGEVHQVGHKVAAEENRRQVGLFDCELLLHDRSNDRLRQGLCILLLDQSFDILTIDLLCCRVVLLVFVKNDGIRGTFICANVSFPLLLFH
jgi:hypothetical protein